MRVHGALAPYPAGHVPSWPIWLRDERLARSGHAGPAAQSLAITPGKVSRHRIRGAGFGVVISHVEHDHQSMNLELRRVWEVYGVHIK